MDVDVGSTGSQGEMVPPQVSPRRTDHIPQSPVRQQSSALQAVTASSQGSNESSLVSLLSQRSAKDSKQLRRPSNTDQEMPSTKVTTYIVYKTTVLFIGNICPAESQRGRGGVHLKGEGRVEVFSSADSRRVYCIIFSGW